MIPKRATLRLGALALLLVVGSVIILRDPGSGGSSLDLGNLVVVSSSDRRAHHEAVPALLLAHFTSDFSEALAREPDVVIFDSSVLEDAFEVRGQLRQVLLDRGTIVALNVPLAVLESLTGVKGLLRISSDDNWLTNTEGYDDPYFSFVYLNLASSGKGQKEIDPYLSAHLPGFLNREARLEAR